MSRRTRRGAAVIGALTGMIGATAGCSIVADGCSAFGVDFAADASGQDSPEAAVEAVADPGTSGLPTSGWRQVGADDGGVRLRSGRATVHVLQFSDGTWAVDSGSTC